MLPEWMIAFWLRIKSLFHRRQLDRDLEDELEFHLAMREQKLADQGTPAEEAHYAARRELGNVTGTKEKSREMWTFAFLETLWQDLRFGLRQLRRNPGFTAVAIITLALGIGANTAIFSLLDAVMLRSIPVRDPSQLVLFRWTARKPPGHGYSSFGDCITSWNPTNASGCSFSLPTFETMQARMNKAFSGITAFAGPAQFDLSGNGPASIAHGELVSGDYFSVLGVSPVIGRTIGPDDDTPAASPVVVLSYAYWQKAFGGNRSVVGRTIVLNSIPVTIAGVAEPSFTHLSPGKTQDFWLPIAMAPRLSVGWATKVKKDLDNWWLVMLGRLKPGASLKQAQATATVLFHNEMLHGAKPLSEPQDNPAIALVPAQEGLTGGRGDFSTVLFVLIAAVGLVLLIACANIGGLLLARATTRTKEMAVRLAVGAGRRRILRQLLTESVMLSAGGGALGILFAYWGVHAITGLFSSGASGPFPFAVAPDWRVLVFTISVCLLAGILFGLAPAWRSTHVDLTPALKETARAAGAGSRRKFHLGSSLVMAQIGLSVVVLVGAGLLVRTLNNLRNINPGFDTHNILLFGIDPTLSGYKDSQVQSLYRNLQARLAALPGVISASYSMTTLLSNSLWTSDVHIEGQPEKKTIGVDMMATGPGFLRTLGIPLLEGRKFTAADFEEAAATRAASKAAEQHAESSKPGSATVQSASAGVPVPVLVNRTFARGYFANENPLGKQVCQEAGHFADGKPKRHYWQVIGVVGDTKYSNLRRAIHPTVYLPFTGGGAHFELRTAGNPSALIPTVRRTVNGMDSQLPLFDVHTQSQLIDELLVQQRLVAHLGSFFGALAILLACIGLYGLLSYEVTRRTHEIGIRMALGAQKRDVLRLVVGQGMILALVGVGIGIIGALGLTRFLSRLLYGVKPTDPVTFVAVSLILTAVALLACYIPARRAMKIDPMEALRYE